MKNRAKAVIKNKVVHRRGNIWGIKKYFYK